MDVPSPAAGKIAEIVVKVGDKVSMGALIGEARRRRAGWADLVGPGGRGGREGRRGRRRSAQHFARCAARSAAEAAEGGRGPGAAADFSGVFAGPAVRRLARELGLDLNTIKGTGEKGRITREDVKAALSRSGAGAAPAGGGALPAVPHGRLRQIRSDRDRSALAHQEDLGPAAARLLGQHSACHAHATKRTSPISTPSARRSTRTRRKTNQSLTACRCCRFS